MLQNKKVNYNLVEEVRWVYLADRMNGVVEDPTVLTVKWLRWKSILNGCVLMQLLEVMPTTKLKIGRQLTWTSGMLAKCFRALLNKRSFNSCNKFSFGSPVVVRHVLRADEVLPLFVLSGPWHRPKKLNLGVTLKSSTDFIGYLLALCVWFRDTYEWGDDNRLITSKSNRVCPSSPNKRTKALGSHDWALSETVDDVLARMPAVDVTPTSL